MKNRLVVSVGMMLIIFSGCNPDKGIEKPKTLDGETVPEYVQTSKDIVDLHGDLSNLDSFYKFVENVKQGIMDEVRVVRYTTEGDPMLHNLKYDGEFIISTTDTRRDNFGSGSISVATCESIEVKEVENRKEYNLLGCSLTNRDNSILVIWEN